MTYAHEAGISRNAAGSTDTSGCRPPSCYGACAKRGCPCAGPVSQKAESFVSSRRSTKTVELRRRFAVTASPRGPSSARSTSASRRRIASPAGCSRSLRRSRPRRRPHRARDRPARSDHQRPLREFGIPRRRGHHCRQPWSGGDSGSQTHFDAVARGTLYPKAGKDRDHASSRGPLGTQGPSASSEGVVRGKLRASAQKRAELKLERLLDSR